MVFQEPLYPIETLSSSAISKRNSFAKSAPPYLIVALTIHRLMANQRSLIGVWDLMCNVSPVTNPKISPSIYTLINFCTTHPTIPQSKCPSRALYEWLPPSVSSYTNGSTSIYSLDQILTQHDSILGQFEAKPR